MPRAGYETLAVSYHSFIPVSYPMKPTSLFKCLRLCVSARLSLVCSRPFFQRVLVVDLSLSLSLSLSTTSQCFWSPKVYWSAGSPSPAALVAQTPPSQFLKGSMQICTGHTRRTSRQTDRQADGRTDRQDRQTGRRTVPLLSLRDPVCLHGCQTEICFLTS